MALRLKNGKGCPNVCDNTMPESSAKGGLKKGVKHNTTMAKKIAAAAIFLLECLGIVQFGYSGKY